MGPLVNGRLAVDLWRLATKQTTPQKLNLIVPVEVAR